MGGQLLAVQVNGGYVRRTIKLQKQPLSGVFFIQLQFPAVTADHLIGHVVAIVQRHFLHRMGQANNFSRSFSCGKFIRPFLRKFPVVAEAQHSHSSHFSLIILYFSVGYKKKIPRTKSPGYAKNQLIRTAATTKRPLSRVYSQVDRQMILSPY